MNELVQRLSEGEHPVVVGGPQPSLSEFQKRIQELGYVFIKFTDTRGGTGKYRMVGACQDGDAIGAR